jgi:hypothetical protein
MKIVIPGKFPSLNEYIAAMNRNRFVGNTMKRENTELVAMIARTKKPKKPYKKVSIQFFWYMKNSRKDPDNIAFAKKFILDGLVTGGVLDNDAWINIVGFTDLWFIDKDERTEVIINEEN